MKTLKKFKLISLFLTTTTIILLPTKIDAREKFLEVFVGGGGGYEYFKLTSTDATKLLSVSLDNPTCATTPTECVSQTETRGHGGLWRAYGGIRLGMMAVSIDYRQSYIQGPISWGQLMGDFWILIPIPIVRPFIKIGAGWIHLKVKDIELPGTESKRDGDLIKGFGFRGGGGLLVKPIKWFSIGATVEVAGTYFKEEQVGTWGYAVDTTIHLTLHI